MGDISTITAAELVAEIEDIHRFQSADKLTRVAGIAFVRFSSGAKGKRKQVVDCFCGICVKLKVFFKSVNIIVKSFFGI